MTPISSGLILALDARNIIADNGDGVATIPAAHGTSHAATAITAGVTAQYVRFGSPTRSPALRFGRLSGYQFATANGTMRNKPGATVQAVMRVSETTLTRQLIWWANGVSDSQLRLQLRTSTSSNEQLSASFARADDGVGAGGLGSVHNTLVRWLVWTITADFVTGEARSYDGLTQIGTASHGAGSNTPDTDSVGVYLAARNLTDHWTGDISAILAYDRVLTTEERELQTTRLLNTWIGDEAMNIFSAQALTMRDGKLTVVMKLNAVELTADQFDSTPTWQVVSRSGTVLNSGSYTAVGNYYSIPTFSNALDLRDTYKLITTAVIDGDTYTDQSPLAALR